MGGGGGGGARARRAPGGGPLGGGGAGGDGGADDGDDGGHDRDGGDPDAEAAEAQRQQLVAGVEVLLRSAEGLPAADRNGLSDPFVILRVGRVSERKSKICWKTLDPVWDEEHFLAAPPRTAMPLEVEVRDMDMLSSECLGRGTVDISWLDESRGAVDLTVDLTLPQGGEPGDAGRVKIQVRRSLRPAKEMDKLSLGQDWVTANRRQRIAVVELIKGQNLVARDDNGYSDAYVRLSLNEVTQQSRVVARSLHPKWRERFEFQFAERRRGCLRLKLEVWDRDILSRDDEMGSAELDLSSLQDNIVNERWVDVYLDGLPAGSLHLLVTIMDSDEDLVLSREQRAHAVGSLRVHLIRARDLLASDRNGRSDPFCEVSLGNARLRTPVEPKTLDPVWDRLVELPVNDAFACLDLSVYDYDPDSRPEPLGAARIPLQSIRNSDPTWIPLKTMDLTRRAQGEVLVAMRLEYSTVASLLALRHNRELSHMESLPAFSVVHLRNSVNRLMPIAAVALQMYINAYGVLTWEFGPMPTLAGIAAWTAFCLLFRPFMAPLGLLLIFVYNYFYNYQGNAVALRDDGLLETRFNDEDAEAVIQQTMDTFGLEEDFDANEALRTSSARDEGRAEGPAAKRKAYFREETAEAAKESTNPGSPMSPYSPPPFLRQSSSSSSLSSLGSPPTPQGLLSPISPSLGRLEQISSMSLASIPEVSDSEEEYDDEEDYFGGEGDDDGFGWYVDERTMDSALMKRRQAPPPAQVALDQKENLKGQHEQQQEPPPPQKQLYPQLQQQQQQKKPLPQQQRMRKKRQHPPSPWLSRGSLVQWGQRQIFGWLKFGISVAKNSYLLAMAKDSFIGDAVRELIAAHAPKLMLLQDGDVLNRPFLEQLRVLSRLGKQFQDQLEFVASSAERVQNLANWTVPSLSMIVFVSLVVATVALLLLPWNICLLLLGYVAFADTWITRYVHQDQYSIQRSRWIEFLARVPSDVDRAKCKPLPSLVPEAKPPPASMKLQRNYSEELRERMTGVGQRIMHIDRYAARKRATS